MNRKERRRHDAQTRATPPGSMDPELHQMMQRATGLHRLRNAGGVDLGAGHLPGRVAVRELDKMRHF